MIGKSRSSLLLKIQVNRSGWVNVAFTQRRLTGAEGTVWNKEGGGGRGGVSRKGREEEQMFIKSPPPPRPTHPHYFSGNSSLSCEGGCEGMTSLNHEVFQWAETASVCVNEWVFQYTTSPYQSFILFFYLFLDGFMKINDTFVPHSGSLFPFCLHQFCNNRIPSQKRITGYTETSD